jgi:ribosomal protein S18 acetylase RimI-like enzyme
MPAFTKQNNPVNILVLQPQHIDLLYSYLQNLSSQTKLRFAPHAFNKQGLIDFYQYNKKACGYIACDAQSQIIYAYAATMVGLLPHEKTRISSYDLQVQEERICTFAPSVADEWQGSGIGKLLLEFLRLDLASKNVSHIILWGGVQQANQNAVRFYVKNGFRTIGLFEYNGLNYDMIAEI